MEVGSKHGTTRLEFWRFRTDAEKSLDSKLSAAIPGADRKWMHWTLDLVLRII